MSSQKSFLKNPWVFIPILYFLQGVPVVIVQQLSVIFYKRQGITNEEIGLWTSLVAWPWILKPLWAPWVETVSTKRRWIVSMQFCIAVALAIFAFMAGASAPMGLTLSILAVIAFLSATHDAAADGYYMLALEKSKQAFFVGIRSTAFRLAMIFGTGALVVIAGRWEAQGFSTPKAWSWALGLGAAIYTLGILIGLKSYPHAEEIKTTPAQWKVSAFKEILSSYFRQEKIFAVLGFILLYRTGESMVSKMSAPFLLDAVDVGGLGVTTESVGYILGNVGVIGLTLGGIIGGFVLSRFGLKKCLWPMVLAMNIPNLLYIWASQTHPSLVGVAAVVGVDQFGYGFGFSAYMVYLMYLAQDSAYGTAHFAISTGLMALGAMGAGISSGYVQAALGYTGFFWATLIASIPGMVILFFIPFTKGEFTGERPSID